MCDGGALDVGRTRADADRAGASSVRPDGGRCARTGLPQPVFERVCARGPCSRARRTRPPRPPLGRVGTVRPSTRHGWARNPLRQPFVLHRGHGDVAEISDAISMGRDEARPEVALTLVSPDPMWSG